jgi:hypothetical protein
MIRNSQKKIVKLVISIVPAFLAASSMVIASDSGDRASVRNTDHPGLPSVYCSGELGPLGSLPESSGHKDVDRSYSKTRKDQAPKIELRPPLGPDGKPCPARTPEHMVQEQRVPIERMFKVEPDVFCTLHHSKSRKSEPKLKLDMNDQRQRVGCRAN